MRSTVRASATDRPDGPHRRRFRGPLDLLAGSRVIDGPVTGLVARVAFPLSRMWAAAEVAGTDVDAFAAAVPFRRCPAGVKRHLSRVLPRIERARARSRDADMAWEAAFFAMSPPPEADLLALETARVKAARALALQRLRLLWTLIRARMPAARFDLTSDIEMEAAWGAHVGDPAGAVDLPADLPAVTRSHGIPGRVGRDYWLRFDAVSARLGDRVWARVREPDAPNPPTFIFVGGVAAEFDQIDLPPKRILEMVGQGIRVVEVEAPFHGRRRRCGEYSGEPYFAEMPRGAIDLLTGMAQELGVVAGWARAEGSPRVWFGGVSMGAFVSQLAGCRAHRWPAAHRPDGLFLIATVDEVHRLPFESKLARLIGLTATLGEHGRTLADGARWRGLIDAVDPPQAGAANVIAVLGRRDRITPFAMAAAQMRRWGVPPENLFIRGGGHFSTPFGMLGDGRAIDRLVAKLKG
jgi:hypothetical protein